MGASLWLGLGTTGVECDRLAPLTVLAALSAFVIALCFRMLTRAETVAQRWQLAITLLLAGATFFGNARFVSKYRGPCNQVERQIRRLNNPAAK